MATVKELIQILAGTDKKNFFIKLATVVNVDVEKATCTVQPIDEDLPLENVRLKAAIDKTNNGFIIVPKVKSFVLIVELDHFNATIIQFSDIDKIIVKNVPEIEFNEGTNGGLIIIDKLKSEIEKINTTLNNIKTAVKSGLTAVGVGSAASGITGANTFDAACQIQTADLSNIVNEKIKH